MMTIEVNVNGLDGLAQALEHVALAFGAYTETKYGAEISAAEEYLEQHDREVEAAHAPAAVDARSVTDAAVALLDAGHRDDLLALLNEFGVPAMTQLQPDQLPAFAERLRQMGAAI